MRLRALGFVISILAVSPVASDPVRATEDSYQTCAVCHGDNAEGQLDFGAPRLAGQGARYLFEQLQSYGRDARGYHPDDAMGQSMQHALVTADLSDAQMQSLSQFLSALDVASNPGDSGGSAARGESLYQASCASCHGFDARGMDAIFAPNLRILETWYLSGQLEAYRKGWRGGGDSATARARNMRTIALQLSSEQEINDIVSYISSMGE